MTYLGPLQRFTGEESASTLLQIFGKIHLLMVIGCMVVGLKNHLDFGQNSLPCIVLGHITSWFLKGSKEHRDSRNTLPARESYVTL